MVFAPAGCGRIRVGPKDRCINHLFRRLRRVAMTGTKPRTGNCASLLIHWSLEEFIVQDGGFVAILCLSAVGEEPGFGVPDYK